MEGIATAQPQQPPIQTPQIKIEKDADSAAKSQTTNDQTKAAEPIDHRPKNQYSAPQTPSGIQMRPGKSVDEASEYGLFFGHRLKITDFLLALFTLFLVLVGIGQGIFLYRTDQGTHKAADAATAAAKVADETLKASRRPWVDAVKRKIAKPLSHDINGVHLIIDYQVTNIGNTPALFVMPEQKIFLAQGAFDIQAEMKNFSDECRVRAKALPVDERRHDGIYIFPNSDPKQFQIGCLVGATEWKAVSNAGRFSIYVFSIVQYFSPVDKDWHQTGVMFTLHRVENGRYTSTFTGTEGDIPEGQLLLRQHVVGAFAD